MNRIACNQAVRLLSTISMFKFGTILVSEFEREQITIMEVH